MDYLTIVTTGGTIDKIYFDDKSDFQIGAPQIGDILTALEVSVTEVRITALEDGVFYAVLVFSNGTEVSARPSDAIALALRVDAPIRGADEVLDAAGIDIPDDEPAPAEDQVEKFREFLDQVSPEDFG